MNKARWEHSIQAAFQNAQLRKALAEFLAENNVMLENEQNTDDGPIYSVRFARPHIKQVERSGRKHWAVKA